MVSVWAASVQLLASVCPELLLFSVVGFGAWTKVELEQVIGDFGEEGLFKDGRNNDMEIERVKLSSMSLLLL